MERHKDVEIIFMREGVWAHRLQKQSMLGGHIEEGVGQSVSRSKEGRARLETFTGVLREGTGKEGRLLT